MLYVLVRTRKDPIEVFINPLLEQLIVNRDSLTYDVFTCDTVPLFEPLQPPVSWFEVIVTKSESKIPGLANIMGLLSAMFFACASTNRLYGPASTSL